MMRSIKRINIDNYLKLIRFDKPIPIMLLLLPILWTIAVSARSWDSVALYVPIFILGAFFMRSAGCIINDLFDIDIDSRISRTQSRPLASNKIKRKEAFITLAVLLGLSLLLLLTLPLKAIAIGIFAIVPISIYPYMKRITYYPQVFLGFTWNLGVLIAWYTFNEQRVVIGILIYIASALWTIGFDTIYALQDVEEDKVIGVKSTAIIFGKSTPMFIWFVYKVMMFIIAIVALNFSLNMFFYLIWGLALYQLHWQYKSIELNKPGKNLQLFNSNLSFGLILLLGFIVGKF